MSDNGLACKCTDETRNGIHRNQCAFHVHACQFGGIGLVPYRINMVAPCGVAQHVIQNNHQQHHGNNRICKGRAAASACVGADLESGAQELQERRIRLDILAAGCLVC